MHQTEQISVLEAATILNESRWTVQRRIRRGELPAQKVGDIYVLNRKDVERLIEAAS